MSFFRKKDDKLSDPMDRAVKTMIEELIRNSKKELKKIEEFFDVLQHYQNPKTLFMELEDFDEYLSEKEEGLNRQISTERNIPKINAIYQELKNIRLIKDFINYYINKSRFKIYDIPPISKEKTTLLQFKDILQKRKRKIEEILNLNTQ
jgi:geranylgeranyl pyrophosphate synthase